YWRLRAPCFGPARAAAEDQSSALSHAEHLPSARVPSPCAPLQSLHFHSRPWELRRVLWTSHTVQPACNTVVCLVRRATLPLRLQLRLQLLATVSSHLEPPRADACRPGQNRASSARRACG